MAIVVILTLSIALLFRPTYIVAVYNSLLHDSGLGKITELINGICNNGDIPENLRSIFIDQAQTTVNSDEQSA